MEPCVLSTMHSPETFDYAPAVGRKDLLMSVVSLVKNKNKKKGDCPESILVLVVFVEGTCTYLCPMFKCSLACRQGQNPPGNEQALSAPKRCFKTIPSIRGNCRRALFVGKHHLICPQDFKIVDCLCQNKACRCSKLVFCLLPPRNDHDDC